MSSASNASAASKLGRKGDSRMHKAVAARLANPEISLFEALQIGGFEYASNEDASAVDGEKVTLGQRKNQLSRRLRLARKQNKHVDSNDAFGLGAGNRSSFSSQGNGSTGSAASLSLEAQRGLQKLMQQSFSSSRAGMSTTLAARALQMKRDNPSLADLSEDDGADGHSHSFHQDEQAKRPRIAKFHPDFAPLFVPPVSSVRNASAALGKTTGEDSSMNNTTASNIAGLNVGLNAGASLPPLPSQTSLFTQQLANPFVLQQNSHPRASAVAISSLIHSAQAVGMTLEQLAMTFASNTTALAKVLAENGAPDADTKKMNLALRIFEEEVKGLYSKSMLVAGLDPRDSQLNSQTYQEFAIKAWQNEGKRLKDLMGGSRYLGEMSFEIDKVVDQGVSVAAGHSTVVSTRSNGDSGEKNSSCQSHEDDISHSHGESGPSSSRKSNGCEGRHLHRIDGLCGHKAIIHKPKDGNAHIDFVVGNKIECYHGIHPVGKNLDAAWPSRFKCKESGDHGHGGSCGELPDATIPKVIELSEINLQDPEWSYDVTGSIDGGVAGLFRLGARTDDMTII